MWCGCSGVALLVRALRIVENDAIHLASAAVCGYKSPAVRNGCSGKAFEAPEFGLVDTVGLFAFLSAIRTTRGPRHGFRQDQDLPAGFGRRVEQPALVAEEQKPPVVHRAVAVGNVTNEDFRAEVGGPNADEAALHAILAVGQIGRFRSDDVATPIDPGDQRRLEHGCGSRVGVDQQRPIVPAVLPELPVYAQHRSLHGTSLLVFITTGERVARRKGHLRIATLVTRRRVERVGRFEEYVDLRPLVGIERGRADRQPAEPGGEKDSAGSQRRDVKLRVNVRPRNRVVSDNRQAVRFTYLPGLFCSGVDHQQRRLTSGSIDRRPGKATVVDEIRNGLIESADDPALPDQFEAAWIGHQVKPFYPNQIGALSSSHPAVDRRWHCAPCRRQLDRDRLEPHVSSGRPMDPVVWPQTCQRIRRRNVLVEAALQIGGRQSHLRIGACRQTLRYCRPSGLSR